MKLLLASAVAGVLMRYAIPRDTDLVSYVGDALVQLVVNQRLIAPEGGGFTTDTMLALAIVPIALIPLLYAAIVGKWGVLSFLFGFFAGYAVADFSRTGNLLLLVAGLVVFAVGVLTVLYARSIRMPTRKIAIPH
jgi:uncharacterized membrane protein